MSAISIRVNSTLPAPMKAIFGAEFMYANPRLSLRTTITFRPEVMQTAAPPSPPDLATLPLAEYAPVSKLRLERTRVERPRFAAIDFHTHLGRWLNPVGDWMESDLAGHRHDAWAVEVDDYLALCDRHAIETSINLDGGWDAELEANLDRLDRAHPGRFLTFCQLDWTLATTGDGFGDELAESLRRSAAAGARGLKVWKTLGLGFRDAAGRLLLPDDERAAPVFAAAGELGLPVLIHTADPPAFFDPVDRHNERLEELARPPRVVVLRPGVPVARAADGVVRGPGRGPPADRVRRRAPGGQRRGPRLARLAARPAAEPPRGHLGPGLATSGASRGRRGASSSAIASGSCSAPTCCPPTDAGLERIFRFLESDDEAYEYAGDEVPPPAGRWAISALGLSDESLRAIYADNARRILGDGERSSDGEQA